MSTKPISRILLVWFILGLPITVAAAVNDQPASTPKLSLAEKEAFLRNAKIVKKWHTPRGSVNPWQAILDDGKMRHDAHIQAIEVSKPSHETPRGTEYNYRDSYKYNIAAYELAKILELDMIPPSVERKVDGQNAAVTWWVDNKMFDEVDRVLRKIEPPDRAGWEKQMHVVRVFDQLIYNTDRNKGNLVITKDWQIWMIDHTRAFRTAKAMENPKNLVQCDRKLLAKMRELNKDELKQKLGKYLNGMEIDGILARRDKIVQFFDQEVASKGQGAVLYDLASVRK